MLRLSPSTSMMSYGRVENLRLVAMGGVGKEKLLPELKLIKPGETGKETLLVDGAERTYFVHVPRDYGALPAPSSEARDFSAHQGDSQKSYPLLITFRVMVGMRGRGGLVN